MFDISLKRASYAAVTALIALSACQPSTNEPTLSPNSSGVVVPGSYIVKYKNENLPAGRRSVSGDYLQDVKEMETYTQSLMRRVGVVLETGDLLHAYVGEFSGFAAQLSTSEAAQLKARPEVEFVVEDRIWTLDITLPDFADIQAQTEAIGAQAAQSTPWGIARVGGAGNGVGKVAYVIDTGVDLDHPDLTVNTSLSRTFIRRGRSADDDNGHGSHVAGTIAAKDNSVGVVGVAAGATIVAIKVLNGQGSGTTADIVAGLNYVGNTASPGSVANLSLGGGIDVALDNAVLAVALRGIFVSLAAGNSARNATTFSPARVNATNLFTVSATDSDDKFASFSNFGNPPIDIAEPGVSIVSTYRNGQYATLSGTSMAAPHAAGILLLRGGSLGTDGRNATNDPAAPADPIGIR